MNGELPFIEEKNFAILCFGTYLQKWIKAFYCVISSVVTNNRHVSELFSLGRGDRPRDRLSTYLFILVLELIECGC